MNITIFDTNSKGIGNTLEISDSQKLIILGSDLNVSQEFKDKIIELYNQGYKNIEIDSPANYEGYSRNWTEPTEKFIKDHFMCD